MYKLVLQDVTKRMRARSSTVKKGKCLCSLWNEVRPVLIAPSGRRAPGAEKTLNVLTRLFIILHFCKIRSSALLSKGFCVCVNLSSLRRLFM